MEKKLDFNKFEELKNNNKSDHFNRYITFYFELNDDDISLIAERSSFYRENENENEIKPDNLYDLVHIN